METAHIQYATIHCEPYFLPVLSFAVNAGAVLTEVSANDVQLDTSH